MPVYQNTLLKKQIPVVQESRDYNTINGNDAELLAGSRFVMACGAEVGWGSRNEDGRKIDLIISYDHPWITKERMLVLIQVKSGETYGQLHGDGFLLKTAAKTAALRTSHAICIIWVERKTHKTFWAYIHPNTLPGIQEYGKNHSITPAARFDIARCQARSIQCKVGGSGVIMSIEKNTLQIQRAIALQKYKSFQGLKLLCPNLGYIEFTRLGWRHMFRKGRMAKRKATSLVVINYLDKIIVDNPTETYISKCDFFDHLDFTYRSIEYVLTYDQVSIFDTVAKAIKSVKIVCRVIEEIRWPKDWIANSTLSQLTERRLFFLSCYYKVMN